MTLIVDNNNGVGFSLSFLSFTSQIFISSLFHIHVSLRLEAWDRHEQVAYYHILCLICTLADYGVKESSLHTLHIT